MASELGVTAILAAYNEADVVGQVVQDLAGQGIRVYLLDHGSSDATVDEVRRCAGAALLGVETLAESRFSLEAIVRRKAELSAELPGSWFINQDADELRESPWLGCSLLEGIGRVDALGYNAIDFEVLNFWPTHDRFRPGDDLRLSFPHYERGGAFDRLQIRAWKRGEAALDLTSSAGHEAAFAGRRVFPLRFLLRHYPIRGQAHGERKVFAERRPRFDASERQRGWHVQYEGLQPGQSFIRAPETLTLYDPFDVRLHLALRHRGVEQAEAALEDARLGTQRVERDLSQRVREIEALNGALELRTREKQRLEQDLAARGQEVAKLHGDLQLRSAEKRQLEQALDLRGGEVERLHADLALRGGELERLHADLALRGGELERLHADLALRGGELERLHADLALRLTEQQQLEQALAWQAGEHERLAREGARERALLTERLGSLDQELAAARTRLRALESSLSWRLTAPLRAAGDWLRS